MAEGSARNPQTGNAFGQAGFTCKVTIINESLRAERDFRKQNPLLLAGCGGHRINRVVVAARNTHRGSARPVSTGLVKVYLHRVILERENKTY